MRSAIPYIRFSSAKQIDSNSLERQKNAVDKWMLAHPEFRLSDLVFEDLGRSSYHAEHIKEGSGFFKLLAAIEAGLIKAGDVVLVEALDRATRQKALDAFSLVTPILRAGVSIITLDDGIEYTEDSLNGSHAYLLVAKIQAAHGYSKILSSRVKDSYAIRKAAALEGKPVKRNVPLWLNTDGTLKKHIAEKVVEAFDLYISGVGKGSIANRFRASGIDELKTCSGPTIEGWLRNRSAIGYWNDAPNVYPAIIDPEKFYLAQKRKERMATKRPEKTAKHFLVGLVKCSVCGSNYIMQIKDGKPHSMRCLTRQRLKDNGCTNTKNYPKTVLDRVVTVTSLDALQFALQRTKLSANEKRLIQLEAKESEFTNSLNKLVDLYANTDLPELADKIKNTNTERQNIRDEIEILRRAPTSGDHLSKKADAAYTEAELLKTDPLQLAAMLRSVDYHLTVYPDGTIECPKPSDVLHSGDFQWSATELIKLKYKGIRREGNSTKGYRLQQGNTEWLLGHVSDSEAGNIDAPPTNWAHQIHCILRRKSGNVLEVTDLTTGRTVLPGIIIKS